MNVQTEITTQPVSLFWFGPTKKYLRNKRKRKKLKRQPRPDLNWNSYQNQIFNQISNGGGHTVIQSGPGTAKTTTLVEALHHIPDQYKSRILFTAFNSSIAEEIRARTPTNVVTKTNHQLGFHTVLKHWGHVYDLRAFGAVDDKNIALLALAKQLVGDDVDKNSLHESLVYTVEMSKILLADSPEEIENIILNYGIDTYEFSCGEFAYHVWELMETTRNAPLICNGKSVISFSDMIWLPHVHGWMPEQFDWLFVDEGQDLNPARIELILNALRYGARLCTAADARQAIYGWAGATTEMLDHLVHELDATQLPLSVSYRCARRIIELAKNTNPALEAAPGAPDGTVSTFDAKILKNFVKSEMAILSRLNYPLVGLCLALLNAGFNANIQGKDIGNRLLWRISCWKPSSVQELIRNAQNWADEAEECLRKKNRTAIHIQDEAKTIIKFAETADNIDEVCEHIRKFFDDETAQVKLSTAHKAKGLEYEKVMLLDKTFKPELGGEEQNIHYVAVTRAKRWLGIATGNLA